MGEERDPVALDRLAERAASGDSEAFERIYLLLSDDLHLYVRGRCRNDAIAEDVVSAVFLKAWKSAKNYRAGNESFRRWIFTIARNEMRDHWRASNRTLPLLVQDFADNSAGDLAADISDEARQAVKLALGNLTEEQRQVIVLRYFNGKNHQQISRLMNKRQGAIRALHLRALRHMRKMMADVAP